MNRTITLDGKQYKILNMSETPFGISMVLEGHHLMNLDESQPHIVQFSHWKEPVKMLIKVTAYANDFFVLKTLFSASVVE